MYNSISEFNQKFPFKQYVADLYGIGNYEYRKTFFIPCPFHPESTGSCAIYDNSYHCFGAGCGAHGNAYDFLEAQGMDRDQILNMDTKYHGIDLAKTISKRRIGRIPEIYIKIYNKDLLDNEDKMQYVLNRHFDVESIKKSKIGYLYEANMVFSHFEAPRYVIPVYDSCGNLVTARYRIDPVYEKNSQEPKYLGHPNTNSTLYNSHIIQGVKDVVIVGSEFDAAFLYHRYNIFAVAPPGEGNFKKEWISYFSREHNVLIWLDYDYAGISASLNLYQSFKSVCNTQIYKWDNSFKNKQDICDFVDKFGINAVFEELDSYDIKAYS